jgi:hypothetical protein
MSPIGACHRDDNIFSDFHRKFCCATIDRSPHRYSLFADDLFVNDAGVWEEALK